MKTDNCQQMPTDFKTVATDTEETLHDFASFMRRTRTISDYEQAKARQ